MSNSAHTNCDADILSVALGAPARQILDRAQAHGQRSGWKDGYLTSEDGFCPPMQRQQHKSLRQSLGAVWLETCQRLPVLIRRAAVEEAVRSMPLISGTSDTISDQALWMASVALMQLSVAVTNERSKASTNDLPIGLHKDEILDNIQTPLSQITERLGMRGLSLDNPYHELVSACMRNCDGAEHSPAWTAQLHASGSELVELAVRAQEFVLRNETDFLMHVLLQMKRLVERLRPILSRTPAELFLPQDAFGQSHDSHSGLRYLGLPVFQLLHAFIGKSVELRAIVNNMGLLRRDLPLNLRAFFAAFDGRYSVSSFVAGSGKTHLLSAWSSLEQAFYGPHGLLALYCQKCDAWQNINSHINPSFAAIEDFDNETSGNTEVLATAYHQTQDHSFMACKARAKVISRSLVDADPEQATALVTLATCESDGLPFETGDQLLVMPLNSWTEVEKVAAALGLESYLDSNVPLYGGTPWDQFGQQLRPQQSLHPPTLTVKDILRYGQVAPLAKEQILALDAMFHGTCPLLRSLLNSTAWPIPGTLGDILQRAIEEVSPVIWDTIFDLEHLSWLTQLVSVGIPQEYPISSPALMGSSLPTTVKITVERLHYEVHPDLNSGLDPAARFGMTSQALHPASSLDTAQVDDHKYPFLIGVAPGSNLRLTSSRLEHVIMFAESRTVGSFRSFWRSRSNSIGQTILFLAHQSQSRFPFYEELQRLEQTKQLQVFAAAAGSSEKLDRRRLLSSLVLDQGKLLWDMLLTCADGGFGGHFYVSGSMALINSLVTGLRRALHNADWTMNYASADEAVKVALMDGRITLDIHPDPQHTIDSREPVPLWQLAQFTGHRTGLRTWVAHSNQVYDLTELHRFQPWHTQTIRFYAGLETDASTVSLFTEGSDLARLLSSFHVGPLASRVVFDTDHMRALYQTWTAYLRAVTKTLTAFAFQVEWLLSTSTSWFTPGNDRELLFDFLRLQRLLLSKNVPCIFGAPLQEIHLRTAFAHVTNVRPDTEVPDIMSIVTRASSSVYALRSKQELRTISNLAVSPRLTPNQSEGIIQYARATTAIELRLLEGVLEEACTAVRSIEVTAQTIDSDLPADTTAKLLSTLERIACRFDAFWQHLSAEGLGKSSIARTQLRSKYDVVQRNKDGVYVSMVLPHPTTLSSSFQYPDQTVSFAYLVDQAMQTVNEENVIAAHAAEQKSTSEISTTTIRKATGGPVGTAYDAQQHRRAVASLASFLGTGEAAIKRLSQLPSDLSFAYIMSTYGKGRPDSSHARSDSAARAVLRTMDEQTNTETPRPRLIRRRTNASSISSSAPRSIFSTPVGGDTPDTMVSGPFSPKAALPFQLTLRPRDRSSSRSAATPLRLVKGPLPVAVSHAKIAAPGLPRRQTFTGSLDTAPPTEQGKHRSSRDNAPKIKPMPTLLPSPLLPDMVSSVGTASPSQRKLTASGLDSGIDTSKSNGTRHVDQVYTFSVTDGPAAGTARAKHVETTPAPYQPVDFGTSVDLEYAQASTLKFGAPRRSRTVERIFTHAHGDLVPQHDVQEEGAAVQAKPKVSGEHIIAEQTLTSRQSSDNPFRRVVPPAKAPVHKYEAPVWMHLESYYTTVPHKIMENAKPAILSPTAKRPRIDQLYTFSSSDGPAAGKPRQRFAEATYERSSAYDQELVDRFAQSFKSANSCASILPQKRSRVVEKIFSHSKQELNHVSRSLASLETQVHPLDKPRKIDQVYTFSITDGLIAGQHRTAHIERPTERENSYDQSSVSRLAEQMRTISTTKEPQKRTRMVERIFSQSESELKRPHERTENTSRNIDQLYTFSVSDGPAANRPRMKHTETPANVVNLCAYDQSLVDTFASQLLPAPTAKLQPRTRVVERIFSHSRSELPNLTNLNEMVELKPCKREVFPSLLMGTRKAKPKAQPGKGLWQRQGRHNQLSTTKPVSQFTLGYVGMWMKPASRIINADYEDCVENMKMGSTCPFRRARRSQPGACVDALQILDQRPASARLPSSQTLGYVGLWMSPPSRKVNEDFELVKIGYRIPQQANTHGKPSKKKASPHIAATRRVPEAQTRTHTPQGLWRQPSQAIFNVQPRTKGYVGMWMRPASKISNEDFEELHHHCQHLSPQRSRMGKREPSRFVLTQETMADKLWIEVRQLANFSTRGFTLGSVGLWMDPPARKTNIDLERGVANVINLLLGEKTESLRRMASDFQKIDAELVTVPLATSAGKASQRSAVVQNDTTATVLPKKCNLPTGRMAGETLGKVGLWMYPPSAKRNMDFEAYRALADSMPDTTTRQLRKRDSKLHTTRLDGARIVEKSKPVGYTNGFVGLWMNPPSKKNNEDFETAEQQSHLPGGPPPRRMLLPPLSVHIETPTENATKQEPGLEVASAVQHMRHLQPPAVPAWAASGDSPTLPQRSGFTPILTPESPTFEDGAVDEQDQDEPSMNRDSARINFQERMKQMELEFGIIDLGLGGGSATATPSTASHSPLLPVMLDLRAEARFSQHYTGPPVPLQPLAQPQSQPQSQPLAMNKKPVLENINTTRNSSISRNVDENGLELLSAVTYTPSTSASSGASAAAAPLLSPANSVRRRPQLPPAAPVQLPSQPAARNASPAAIATPLAMTQAVPGPPAAPTPPPAPTMPSRSQSVKQTGTPTPSRVSSVRSMWEKRASLVAVADSPTLGNHHAVPPLLRSRTRSPPEPLKLVRSNNFARGGGGGGGNRGMVVKGFEIVGGGGGGVGAGYVREMQVVSPAVSPLTPVGVR